MTRRGVALLIAGGAVALLVAAATFGRPALQGLVDPTQNCGSDRLDPGTGKVNSTDVRQCILAAYGRHVAARSEHVLPTAEGDPITFVIRLTGRDDLELTIDRTQARSGPRDVAQFRCGGLTSTGTSLSLSLTGCEPGGSAIQIQ